MSLRGEQSTRVAKSTLRGAANLCQLLELWSLQLGELCFVHGGRVNVKKFGSSERNLLSAGMVVVVKQVASMDSGHWYWPHGECRRALA